MRRFARVERREPSVQLHRLDRRLLRTSSRPPATLWAEGCQAPGRRDITKDPMPEPAVPAALKAGERHEHHRRTAPSRSRRRARRCGTTPQRTSNGAESILVVHGGPGLGKSSLLAHAAETAAARSFWCGFAGADAGGGRLDMAVVIEALAGGGEPLIEPDDLRRWDASVHPSTLVASGAPGRARTSVAATARPYLPRRPSVG